MVEERGVLRRIVWRDVFPGILLFSCFRLSIGLPILFLATVGIVLMPIGPWVAQRTISPENSLPAPVLVPPGAATPVALVPGELLSQSDRPFWAWPAWLPNPHSGLQHSYLRLVRPFARLFDRQATLGQLLGNVGVASWYLLVWSLMGGAITRIAVVRLGCGEQVPLRQSVRYAVTNLGWYFASPVFPLLGVAFTAVPLFFLGLLMHANFGVLVAGILWPLALIAGFIMTVLLVGLIFGWPLMWPTISAEEASDSFQAFSNSFSFTFQRPLQYVAYVLIAFVLGGLGGLFVEGFAGGVVALTHWGLSFGLGRERLNQLVTGQSDHTSLVSIGSGLMDLGNQLVATIASAYYFSFMFCAASAIYLLLRREVDQTDFDEVYLPEKVDQFSLPPLRSGPHGVPEVDEAPPISADRPSE